MFLYWFYKATIRSHAISNQAQWGQSKNKYQHPLYMVLSSNHSYFTYKPLTLTTTLWSLWLCYPFTNGWTGLEGINVMNTSYTNRRDSNNCLMKWCPRVLAKFSMTWLWRSSNVYIVRRMVTSAQEDGGSVIQPKSLASLVFRLLPKQMKMTLILPIMGSLRWSHKMRFMKVFNQFLCALQIEEIHFSNNVRILRWYFHVLSLQSEPCFICFSSHHTVNATVVVFEANTYKPGRQLAP